jgi:hypothetical protein
MAAEEDQRLNNDMADPMKEKFFHHQGTRPHRDLQQNVRYLQEERLL